MSRFVVIGETSRVAGFALGGATVACADDAGAVELAWAALPGDAAVVLLTPQAAAVLTDGFRRPERALTAVMPP